jgi:type II secretory pathway pseudopilin PulG
MVAVLVLGVLVSFAIPNYLSMQEHAREAMVKENAHTLHLTAEDYGVQHEGVYSDAAIDLLPLLPGQSLLENAFTRAFSEPQFAAPAALPGQIGIQAVASGGVNVGYAITGFGKTALILSLTNGS